VRRRYFRLMAILIIAIGIATTTTIFAVVDAVVLRPLPYPDADRLVSIREMRRREFAGRTSPGRLEDWRQRTRTLEAVAGLYIDNFSAEIAGAPARLSGAVVSPGFFQVIGSAPVAGRTFLPQEERADGPRAALISDRLSKRLRVGPGAVMRLGSDVYAVVGVMPASLAIPLPTTDVWIAKQARPALLRIRQARNYNVIGRARPDALPAQVAADLDAIQIELGRLYPSTDQGIRIDVSPFKVRVIGGSPATLWPLFGAALVILLVTCANTTCLMVAAMPGREAEMRTRVALGATWRDVHRLLVGESLTLAAAGGLISAIVAAFLLPLLRRQLTDFPRITELAWHVETTAVLVLQTALMWAIFAAIPAVWMRRRLSRIVAPARAVSGAEASSRTLVVLQLALATLLVMSSAALMQTLLRLQRVPLGLDVTNVMSLRVSASSNDGSPVQVGGRQIRIAGALARVPGVEHVAASADMPGVDAATAQPFRLLATDVSGTALVRPVTGSYFRTLRIPVEKGTSCAEGEDPSAAAAAVVNQSFVRRFLSGRDPIGMAVDVMGYSGSQKGLPILGIAANVREQGYASDIEPVVYICGPMRFWAEPYYLVRSSVPAESIITALRAAAEAMEPSRAVFGVAPAADVLSDTLARPRFQAGLMGTFAMMALILAATGLYGVLAYLVALRRADIGIRLAVGARGVDVAAHVIGRALQWAGAGIAVGYALLVATAPLLSYVVDDAMWTNATSFVLTALVLLLAAVGASSLPAWRASQVSPAELMRESGR